MSIFFCGDPYGQFGHVVEAVREHRPAAVILLGDTQAQRPLQIELADILSITDVWFIAGDHDTNCEADYDNLFGSTLADRNLDGRVVDVAGVRIAGLSGVFRGRVWHPPEAVRAASKAEYMSSLPVSNRWRGGLPLKHGSTIFPDDVQRLAQLRADVLVSHEAPSCHPYGFAVIDDLAHSLHVHTAFHGHHHQQHRYDDAQATLGFAAYSVGFRGITARRERDPSRPDRVPGGVLRPGVWGPR